MEAIKRIEKIKNGQNLNANDMRLKINSNKKVEK